MKADVITYFRSFVDRSFEQFSDRRSVNERASQDSEYIEHAPVETAVMFGDSNKAVSRYGTINLYPDCVFRVTPKGFDVQMLLDPFEKQLHLPTLFIKHCNIFCTDIESIGNIYKRAFEFLGVVHDSAKPARIFLLGLISGKFDSLITDDSVNTLDKVFTINNLILKPSFLTDDKVRIDDVDFIQSDEIKVASVEDVVCIGFVRDIIHRLSIVNVGIGDIDVGRNLSDDIKKRMSLDSTFCAAELCPPEKAETEVNCRGIKSIKLPVKVKWCINSFILRNLDEFPGKLLKYTVIPVRVCLGKVRQLYLLFAKSKMIGLLGMSRYHADEFSESFAAVQLAEHHDKQLVPAGKVLDILVSVILFDYPIKGFLWQKLDELCKYIRSVVHIALRLGLGQYMKSNVDVGCIAASYYI